jgi:hypothetical protein
MAASNVKKDDGYICQRYLTEVPRELARAAAILVSRGRKGYVSGQLKITAIPGLKAPTN